MITPTKRACLDRTSKQENLSTDIELPFGIPFFTPNQRNQFLPKAILYNHIVTFLTFREQSNTVALISKAFNDLATFARNEQNWRDHIVYFVEAPSNITFFNPSKSIYHLFSPKFNKGFQITEYFYWKLAQNKKKHHLPFVIDLPTLSHTIHLIKKIWIGEDYTNQFRMTLIGNNQIQTIGAIINPFHCSTEPLLNRIAETCQNLKKLTLKFKKSPLVLCWNSASKVGLGTILQNCNQLSKLSFHISDIGNLRYINNAIDYYSSNYIPLKYLELKGRFLETSSLNDELSKLLQKSPQLLEIHFTVLTSYKPYHAYKWCIDFPLSILSKNCPNLRGLILGDDVMATDESFGQFLASCKHLTYFSYLSTEKNFLTVNTFINLLQHPAIESLDLSIHIPESILYLDATHICHSLRKFCFDDSLSAINTDPAIIINAAAKFFPNLTSLTIRTREKKITDTNILHLISNCPINDLKLQFLDNDYFTDNSFKGLLQSSRLKKMQITLYVRTDIKKRNIESLDKSDEDESAPFQGQGCYIEEQTLIPMEERVSILYYKELFEKNNKSLKIDLITLI